MTGLSEISYQSPFTRDLNEIPISGINPFEIFEF